MRKHRLLLLALVIVVMAQGASQALAATITISSDIVASTTWTADNEYILDKPIYVLAGATLTIAAGTVVRGDPESAPGALDPGALIITRGAKIRALGTALRPIVFTDMADDNIGGNPGTFPYDTAENARSLTGQWGGLIVLGRAYVSNNSLAGPNAAREVQIEGLTASGGLGLYGNGGNDDDDSGTLCYVSIRYGGYNLAANNEINGLTLGGVGRLTDVDHIEVFQNKDDLVEVFGGTVNLKYLAGGNGGDDGLDYDEGWRGKAQFLFIVQGTPGTDKSDKGGEWDGGNAPDGSQPFALPTIYNATMIGLGQKAFTNSLQNTALQFRDNAGGRVYNSFFADFGGAPICIEGGTATPTSANTSGERAITPYVVDSFQQGPPSAFQLELQNDTWFCTGNGGIVPTGDATAVGCVAAQVHHDNGLFSNAALKNQYLACGGALPIRTLTRTSIGIPATSPDPIGTIDPRPSAGSALLTTDRTPPADGFFEPAPYRGAFGSTNWADGWTAMSRLGLFPPKPVVNVTADVTTSQTWVADNVYQLDKPIYVTNGATLTIAAGTTVRGESESAGGAHDPGTLIVSRGAKIQAVGTADAPIVFTDLADDNIGLHGGTFPYDTPENARSVTGQWGGLILLGRAYVSNNSLAGPNAAREVQIEGLDSAGGIGLYGNGGNDDDDSGRVEYVSIRYGGFNLSANNEINGLTLGAVGRQTNINHVEVFQNKDDLVEAFGGTVNLKYIAGANGGDDGLDYDEGWRGKAQFLFVVQGTPGSDKSDKAGEWDGGNAPDGSQPFALPTIYNATFVGLGQKGYTNKLQNTALQFRDNAGGRVYNSYFADFGGAPICIEGGTATPTSANTSGERSITPYVVDAFQPGPTSSFQLELQNNTWWCAGNGGSVPVGDATANGCVAAQIHYDNGLFSNAALNNAYLSCATTDPLRLEVRQSAGIPATSPDPMVRIDPRPRPGSPLLTGAKTTPIDGFFSKAPYRGAFGGSNWAACWTTMARLGYFPDGDPLSAPLATPDEAVGLAFLSKTTMTWSDLPAACGCIVAYDVLRSANPADFTAPACVESDDFDTAAADAATPAVGTAFFYLVRGGNGAGEGTLGLRSSGVERVGGNCP